MKGTEWDQKQLDRRLCSVPLQRPHGAFLSASEPVKATPAKHTAAQGVQCVTEPCPGGSGGRRGLVDGCSIREAEEGHPVQHLTKGQCVPARRARHRRRGSAPPALGPCLTAPACEGHLNSRGLPAFYAGEFQPPCKTAPMCPSAEAEKAGNSPPQLSLQVGNRRVTWKPPARSAHLWFCIGTETRRAAGTRQGPL